MSGRLYTRIYGGIVAVGLACILVLAGLASWHADRSEPPEVRGAVALMVEHLDAQGGVDQGRLDHMARAMESDVTLWDSDGETLASSGEAVPFGPPGWEHRRRGRGLFRLNLPDGRRVGIASRHPRAPPFFLLVPALLLAGVVGLGAVPLARSITGPLEDVRNSVDAWGAGDLSVRAPVEGTDEVAQVATAFNSAADRVEALVQSQRRVLASTSHELRSPLARLRMTVALMEDEDPERQRLAAAAEVDIAELDATIGELLQVGRMQAVGLESVARVDVAALLRGEAERVGATVRSTEPLVVDGDARLLTRLLRNLLENAVRHGGGEVEAWTTAAGVVVADRGAGISEAEAERVFEPFHRPEGHDEGRDGGVGLGLWLVREVATAHGAVVTHQPREGGGTRFAVVFGEPGAA